MPDDHLLRLTSAQIIEAVKNQPHFPSYKDSIEPFRNMFCEIAGWCKISELEKVTSIPGQEFDGNRFVKKTGQLHRGMKDWEVLLSRL